MERLRKRLRRGDHWIGSHPILAFLVMTEVVRILAAGLPLYIGFLMVGIAINLDIVWRARPRVRRASASG